MFHVKHFYIMANKVFWDSAKLLVPSKGLITCPHCEFEQRIDYPQYYVTESTLYNTYKFNNGDLIFQKSYAEIISKVGTSEILIQWNTNDYIEISYYSREYYGRTFAYIHLRFHNANGWINNGTYDYIDSSEIRDDTTSGQTFICLTGKHDNYPTLYVPFFITYTKNGIAFYQGGMSLVNSNSAQTVAYDNLIRGHVISSEDPYITSEESEPAGGYGDFDYTSDEIPLPSAPSISVSDSGFITLYKPSLTQLQQLATYLWSGLFDISNFRKIFADPMDCIISLAFLPISPYTSGSQELKVGNIGTGITVDKLTTQFVEVNFKTLNIGLRANSFMDYSPYTKIDIFLPFIGTRSLSIDDIAGRNIKLRYIIDIFTGACNAALGSEVEVMENGQKVKKITTLYQFTGNVLANVPVTSNNFASFLQATVNAVSTAVGVATGAGAMAGVASAINSATAMKPDIEKSGNLSSTAGFLGVQKPYLILSYPNLCRPTSRDKVAGTPSFIGLNSDPNHHIKLSKFKGFTQLHKINVKGIPCTENERQMIFTQLTGEGVILP